MPEAAILVSTPRPVRRTSFKIDSSYIAAGLMLFPLAIALLSYVSNSVGPAVFGLCYLGAGLLIGKLLDRVIPGGPPVSMVICASLAVCLTVAGFTQLYALWFSGELQNTTDATQVFYPIARIGLQNGAFSDVQTNSDGAIWVWQFLYEWARLAGFGDGPWVGISFNCFLISISSGFIYASAQLVSCTGRAARGIAVWCVYSPMFWLTAAIHLRDAFTVFCSAAVMLLLFWLMVRPSIARLLSVTVACASVVAFSFLVRQQTSFILGAIALVGLACAVLLSDWKQLFGRSLAVVVLIAVTAVALGFLVLARTAFDKQSTALLEDNLINTGADSLGSVWIMRAAWPLRLVLGTYYMFVHPIPLWVYIGPIEEYLWFRGLNGYAMMLAFPFLADGLLTTEPTAMRRAMKLFAVAASAIGIAGVVLTSMEARHVIEFAPFILVLLAFSPPGKFQRRRRLIWQFWAGSIALAHLGWFWLKG